MKKILFLTTLVLIISTQIVKAFDIKDATLKNKGTQTDASTIAWLTAEKLDGSLINMTTKQFSSGLKTCLVEFNNQFETFHEISGDVIYDNIIPGLYTKALVPGRLYSFSYWNVTTQSWGRWKRVPEPGEKGLFYPGWGEDPIMSTHCWNFAYPTKEKIVVPPPVPEGKTEYVFIPGTKKVIVYGVDTVETTRSSVQIDRTNTKVYQFNDNQSFQVESNQFASNKQYNNEQQSCNHKQVNPYNHQQADEHECKNESTCGKKKHKCNRGFWAVGGAIVGASIALIAENNLPVRGRNIRNPITQGLLEPLGITTENIVTQAGLYQ